MGRKLPAAALPASPDPATVADTDDPGDETQRNFRYQHAYGAILLVAAATGREPYHALWCEHHEDLLAERADSTYEAYQVKTRRPELGEWKLTDEAISHSLKRFVGLHQQFGLTIRRFAIVSNADFATSGLGIKDVEKLKRSPVRLLEAVQASADAATVAEPFKSVLTAMAHDYGCPLETLFEVLKRTFLVKGPSRDYFDSEVAHQHVATLPECRLSSAAQLNAVRDELIQRVYGASSLQIDDPRQHLPHIDGQANPRLLAKRVGVAVVASCAAQAAGMVFRYQTGDTTLAVGQPGSQRDKLREKFVHAGLADQLRVMERRTLDTEQHLIALAHAEPETFDDLLKQLQGVVEAECAEAQLEANLGRPAPTASYGPVMLQSVLARLKTIARDTPRMVGHQPYECLVGIAGLLTEECTVWWGDKFQLSTP